MRTIFNIWTSLSIATLIVVALYFCSCTTIKAEEKPVSEEIEYYLEDNYCLAPNEGIVLQDVQFINESPYYANIPVVFSPDVCATLTRIFNSNDAIYPIAAVIFYCGDYAFVDLD